MPSAPGMIVIAFCGDPDVTLRAVEERTRQNPTVSSWNSLELPLVTAVVHLRKSRPDQAVAALEAARRHDL